MKRHSGDIVNADRSARKAHGVTNFVTVHDDGGIIFHDDPLATALANMPRRRMGYGQSPTPQVWMSHDDPRYVDEWARVQEMRRKDPGGLVAGGRATIPGDFIKYDVHDHAIFEKGLRGIGQGKKNMAARHYSSN